MSFTDKIQTIENLLPNDKRIKDKTILACGIYFKIKMQVSFRALPTEGTSYSWSIYRHWLQRLDKLGKLKEIKGIVGGGEVP